MSKEVYRIEIPIETVDKYSPGLKNARNEVSKFEKETKRMQRHMDRMNHKRWAMTIRAVDRATHVIHSINSFAGKVAGRTYHLTFRAIDMVTRPIRSIIKNITSSAFGLLGLAGGIAGGVVLPLKVTMDRQNITTAFEVLLGSAEKANERITELIDFAGQTPYTRDEIFRSSRVLEVFTKGAISTGEGLRMVGDIAAGTQNGFEDVALWIGRMYDAMSSNEKIGAMTSRLQEMGAIDGAARARLEKLAEKPMDIAKKWELARKEFQRFDGMMGKMSNNLANLLLGVKSFFMNNVISRWGAGIERVLSPALSKFRDWRNENAEGIQNLGNAIERYGERVTKFVVNKVGGAFGTIQRLFFPSQKEIERMTELQKHLLPEDAAQLPINLTFSDKVKMAWDDIVVKPFQEWWEGKGKKWVEETGLLLGEAIFKGVKKGFKNGINGIGNIWGDALKNPSASSIGGAMTSTLLAGAIGSMVLSPLFKVFSLLFKGLWKMIKGAVSLFDFFKGFSPGGSKGGAPTSGNTRSTRSERHNKNGNSKGGSTNATRSGRHTPKTTGGGWSKLLKWGGGPLGFLMTFFSDPLSVSAGDVPLDYDSSGKNAFGGTAAKPNKFNTPTNQLQGEPKGGDIQSASSLLTEKITNSATSFQTLDETIKGFGGNVDAASEFFMEGITSAGSHLNEFAERTTQLATVMTTSGLMMVIALQQNALHLTMLATVSAFTATGMMGSGIELISSMQMSTLSMKILSIGASAISSGIISNGTMLLSSIYQTINSFRTLSATATMASSWVSSINGIQSEANSVKSALNNLATRINNVKISMPSLSSSQNNSSSNVSRGATLSAYANGGYIDRPHLGLVGEAGPEMIIPLSSGRRSRAMELYERTGQMLGVKPYKDGGLVGKFIDNNESAIIPSVGTTIVIDGVKTEVNITVQSDGEIDTKGLGKKIADDVAFAIARAAKEAAKNLPIPAN